MKSTFIYRLFQNTSLIFLSLGLMYCGVLVLRMQIPFWSQLYGLSSIFVGMLMVFVTFNEIMKNHNPVTSEFHTINCSVCGKGTLAPYVADKTVCVDCQRQMAARLHMGIFVVIITLSIPVTLHLVQISHDIRQQAKINSCSDGAWEPEICRCGTWQNTSCDNGYLRKCGNETYCCRENGKTTTCVIFTPDFSNP